MKNYKPVAVAVAGIVLSIGLIAFYGGIVRGKVRHIDAGQQSRKVTQIMDVTKIISGSDIFSDKSLELVYSQTFSVSEISNFDISLLSENLSVEVSDTQDDNVVVNIYASDDDTDIIPKVALNGSTLKINQNTIDFAPVKFWRCSVKITVPSGLTQYPENWKISNTSGSINIDQIQATKLVANNVSGSVSLEDTAFDFVVINCQSGSIKLEQSKVSSVSAQSTSGSIKIEETETKEIELKSTSGSVKIEDGTNGIIKIASTSGSIKVDGSADSLNLGAASGSILADLDKPLTEDSSFQTVSGSIKLEMPDNSGFACNFSTVSSSIDDEFSGFHSKGKGSFVYKTPGPELNFASISGSIKIDSN